MAAPPNRRSSILKTEHTIQTKKRVSFAPEKDQIDYFEEIVSESGSSQKSSEKPMEDSADEVFKNTAETVAPIVDFKNISKTVYSEAVSMEIASSDKSSYCNAEALTCQNLEIRSTADLPPKNEVGTSRVQSMPPMTPNISWRPNLYVHSTPLVGDDLFANMQETKRYVAYESLQPLEDMSESSEVSSFFENYMATSESDEVKNILPDSVKVEVKQSNSVIVHHPHVVQPHRLSFRTEANPSLSDMVTEESSLTMEKKSLKDMSVNSDSLSATVEKSASLAQVSLSHSEISEASCSSVQSTHDFIKKGQMDAIREIKNFAEKKGYSEMKSKIDKLAVFLNNEKKCGDLPNEVPSLIAELTMSMLVTTDDIESSELVRHLTVQLLDEAQVNFLKQSNEDYEAELEKTSGELETELKKLVVTDPEMESFFRTATVEQLYARDPALTRAAHFEVQKELIELHLNQLRKLSQVLHRQLFKAVIVSKKLQQLAVLLDDPFLTDKKTLEKLKLLVLENAERKNNSDNITEHEILENMNERLQSVSSVLEEAKRLQSVRNSCLKEKITDDVLKLYRMCFPWTVIHISEKKLTLKNWNCVYNFFLYSDEKYPERKFLSDWTAEVDIAIPLLNENFDNLQMMFAKSLLSYPLLKNASTMKASFPEGTDFYRLLLELSYLMENAKKTFVEISSIFYQYPDTTMDDCSTLTIPFCDWSQVLIFKGSFKIDLLKYPHPKAVVLSGFWVDGLLVENFSNARELFVAYQLTEDFSLKGFCKLLTEAFCKWSSACERLCFFLLVSLLAGCLFRRKKKEEDKKVPKRTKPVNPRPIQLAERPTPPGQTCPVIDIKW
ncbi:hypothetical protein T4B_15116 [Trichinella pseudospiralis]|uniref:Uncharacterized protein n=1 Tax=Trichinella pseudospiralis TaxID=6337 RepID=A0A0V1J0F3_TRIPS|nr:hypothetical protein T4B_15116 [Trichinella pseudospiralis]